MSLNTKPACHSFHLCRHNSFLLKSFSAFGAVVFSLGSVLIWAILRSVVPQNVGLCTVCGIGSGFALIKIGRNYTDHLDSLVK